MNDNSLGIREAKNTVVQSELDRIMQQHIDSGQFTKEQLAEMRKAEANKLKEAKAAEKQRAEMAKSGPIEGSQVEAFNTEVKDKDKTTETPKKEDGGVKVVSAKGMFDREEDIDLSGFGGLAKVDETKKTEISYAFKNKELPEEKKQILIDQFGTLDADKIIGDHLTDENGNRVRRNILTESQILQEQITEQERLSTPENDPYYTPMFKDKSSVTYINPNDLPVFDDKEIMEYLYAPYMEDSETIMTQSSDLFFGLFGVDDDYTNIDSDRKRNTFNERFASSNTDRGGILNYIKAKQSNSYKEQFNTQYELGEGLDVGSNEYANVAQLSGKDKDTFDLIQNGEGDKAAQLNEDNGFYTLYNKDGKYINWTELSDEDKANADPNNVLKVSKEDEERAKILSERHKPAKLQMQQMQNRHDLVAAANMYRDTHGEARYNIDSDAYGGNIGLFNSVDDFNAATLSAAENNSLMGGLVEAVGDDEVTKAYNEALKKYLITGRALELNQDLSKLAEEGSRDISGADFVVDIARNVGGFLYNPDEFADYTADEQVEAFGGYMEETGAVMNDDWKRVTREGGDWLMPGGIEMFGSEVDIREVTEGGRDFVKHIAPLVASLYITKKIPLGGLGRVGKGAAWGRNQQAARTLGGQVHKGATSLGNWIKRSRSIKGVKVNPFNTKIGRLVTDLTIGGAEELLYLSIADQVGGKLFDMDPMVYDPKEDNLNWEFAFGLGVGNVMAKKVVGRLMNTQRGAELMGRISKYKVLEKAFERGIGATSGVGSMEIAKVISGDSELMKIALDGGELTKDQKNEMYLSTIKTAASDWLGMFMLGYITPGGKVGEALSKDIQNFKIEKLNTSKDAKKLGIKENATSEQVEAAVYKKKAEATKKYLKSGKTEKDAQTRDKELAEIKKAEDNIDGRASIRAAKEAISKDKKRLAEVEREIRIYNKKITSGRELSGKDILKLTSMNKAEFNYLLKKMNNKQAAEYLNAKREFYKASVEYVKEFGNISSRKQSIKLLEEVVNYHSKKNAIDYLKSSNDKGKNDARIKKLKEDLAPIEEAHKESLKSLEKKYEEAVNKEMLVAKAIAKGLGAEFEIAESTEDYLKRAKDPEAVGTAGFHMVDPKTGKSMILVDPVKAASVKTIGTGIHETVHHILKDAFKEKYTVTEKNEFGIPVKTTKTRISREGVAIIDKFLDSLGEKGCVSCDRNIIEKELSERYRDEKVQIPYRKGVESYEQKSKYYEEVLTTYVEALKNKQITLDLPTGQRIQNVFLPHINKVFPNIGKKEIKMFEEKDANNLKNMLNDIFLESERLGNMSKYEVKNLMVKNPIKFAEGYEVFTEVSQMDLAKSFSKYPEMKKINAVGEKYTRQEWRDGKWMEGYEEILPEIIKVLTKKSFEANKKYPGIIADPQSFAFQVANELGGLNPNQQKVGGHVRNFDIEKKTYDKEGSEFGLSGWINNVADLKLLNVLKRADKIIGAKKTKSLDVEDFKELVDEGPSAMDIIDSKRDRDAVDRVVAEFDKPRLHEVIFNSVASHKGKQAKQIHDGIRERFTNKEGIIDVNKLMETVKGKKMKNLPVLVLPETIDLFTNNVRVETKKGEFVIGDKVLAEKIANKIKTKSNLDGTDIAILQKGLDKYMSIFAEHVNPQGFITKSVKGEQVPGETTGIPRKILEITHTKRSIAGVTTIDGNVRSNENFFGQYKKTVKDPKGREVVPQEVIDNLREAIGIMKDGTRNLNTRKNQPVKGLEGVGETLKGVVTLFERMFTSQGLREPMYSMGKIFEPEMLAIADGKPQKSFSNVNEKRTLEMIAESYQIDPVGTSAFISKVQREWQTLSDIKWQEFKDKNGRELIDGIEGLLLTPENKGDKSSYTKDNFKGDTPAHAFIRDMASKGGIMKQDYKLIVRDSNGKKVLSNAGENQITQGRLVLENMLPIMLNAKGITAMLGFKGLSFDGRTLPNMYKGVDARDTKSILSEMKAREKALRFKEMGIDVDAILDAVPMVKESPIIKKALNTFMKGRGSVAEKFAESLAKGEKVSIDILNIGNENLHKALVENNRELFADNVINVEYVFNEGKLQTNITSSKRAVSSFKMVYVVDGKQIADSYGTTKQMSHTSKGKFKGTMQEYYDSPKYKEYLKDWKECVEWNERYNKNLKDPKLKESAEKNGIKPETQAEKQTIEDLVPFNEHINGNANAMVEGNNYIFSNGKGGKKALDAIGKDHATAWVPSYVAKKTLDFYGPNVSKKGYGRLTAYLPAEKLRNMYTHDGKPATQHIAETQRFQAVVDKINNTTKANVGKTIESVVKNYSKLKGRDPLKDLITIAKATNLGRLSNKKPKGMSAWDFDDTLATTKSGVRARIPNADGKPKPNRKVIFLAGGAGSGKGNVVKKLNLEGQGFKVVNSDISLEWLKKNNGLPENMNDLSKAQLSTLGKLQYQSRQIAKNKMMKYRGNAEGVVVDGTGGSIKSMEKLVNEFKGKGYDVSMLFVETSLSTALARNQARAERSLLDKIVEKNHENVQGNKSGFKTMFGERFMEVKTDKLKQEDAMPPELVAKMNDFVSGYEKIRLDAEQFATEGKKILDKGGKFDFSEFNVVTGGEKGPFFQKALDRVKKFGTKDQFVLTARPAEAAGPIHEFLKSQGLEIPLKNITGLGNSTGEAKAMWMLEKFKDGYNDMYFADDAMQNVDAVKKVLDQLDIKSKVQQAKQFNRTKLSRSFNDILQQVEGVKSEASFSDAKGRLVGEKKGKFRFGAPGMEDFAGLVTYKFAGKGKQGEAHKKFFEDNLQRPFSRAYNEINIRKQSISEDYKALRKAMPEARKLLSETVDGIYTVDQAIRVYNFKKAGYEAPGLSKTDSKKLISYIESNPKLVAFADQLSKITMLKEGYIKPVDYWLGENITMDMNNVVDKVFRKEALAEFVENRKEIFGEWKGGKLVGENMNKIESLYGPRHREALENMLWRMENGTNRRVGADSATNKWMNWINSATGTIMFFNQKSAALQTISSLNYVNGTFNNPLRAAQAFANQPQYWKDFVFLFNSPMMLQRRSGLKINIEAAELLERVGGKEGGFARFRKYILEKGFIPTKYADGFAIASGGATFYRNSIRKYKKQGMSEKEAQQRAFEDFQQMTEATQQSSRPDLISMQQASGLGRPILAFANTPMQMFRRHKRRLQDIANRRGNTAENVLSAVYYGFAQTMIFSYLANAMFAVDDESEDEDDKRFADTAKTRFVQTIADSYLRGMGLVGAGVSAIKNGILSAVKETKKANADYGNTVIDLLNISPPIGSKARKLYSAGKTYKYNKDVIPEMGFRLDNPATLGVAKVISAFTNLPADRVVQKLLNIKNASNADFENWQRIAMFMGLSNWSIGAKDEKLEAEIDAIEKRVKKSKKKEKKQKEDVGKIEANKKKQIQERKQGKTVTCAAVSKSGNRCKTKVESGSSYCTIHAKVKQNKSGKKTQCRKTKSNGKRCKMKTSASSGYCYYHD